jgi:hypothetical protein
MEWEMAHESIVQQSAYKVKHPRTTPLARPRKSGQPPRDAAPFAVSDPGPQRKAALIDLCAWAIATGRVELIARSWLALEVEVHDA